MQTNSIYKDLVENIKEYKRYMNSHKHTNIKYKTILVDSTFYIG